MYCCDPALELINRDLFNTQQRGTSGFNDYLGGLLVQHFLKIFPVLNKRQQILAKFHLTTFMFVAQFINYYILIVYSDI